MGSYEGTIRGRSKVFVPLLKDGGRGALAGQTTTKPPQTHPKRVHLRGEDGEEKGQASPYARIERRTIRVKPSLVNLSPVGCEREGEEREEGLAAIRLSGSSWVLAGTDESM